MHRTNILSKKFGLRSYLLFFKLIYRKNYLFTLNNIYTFSIDLHIHSSIMYIYFYLAMSILVIIHSKAILIKTMQTTFILFNQFYVIVSKHKLILSKSILTKSILSESILSESILSESILSKAEPNTPLEGLDD